MSKDKELKAIPCPLCNGKAFWNLPIPEYDNSSDKHKGWTFGVSCHVCGIRLTSGGKNLEELDRIKTKLITAWNTRAGATEAKLKKDT